MTRPRNSQYAKFWKAQGILASISRELKTEKQVERFVSNARERAFLKRRYPHLQYGIHVSHEETKLVALYNEINIPPAHRREHEICRQIAIVLFYRADWREQWAWHGWQFCAIYLDVVRAMMGKKAHDVLKASFRANRVRFAEKKSRAASPEMLAALEKARHARKEKKNASQAQG
jgi:hypothetical protein